MDSILFMQLLNSWLFGIIVGAFMVLVVIGEFDKHIKEAFK